MIAALQAPSHNGPCTRWRGARRLAGRLRRTTPPASRGKRRPCGLKAPADAARAPARDVPVVRPAQVARDAPVVPGERPDPGYGRRHPERAPLRAAGYAARRRARDAQRADVAEVDAGVSRARIRVPHGPTRPVRSGRRIGLAEADVRSRTGVRAACGEGRVPSRRGRLGEVVVRVSAATSAVPSALPCHAASDFEAPLSTKTPRPKKRL
jgi:hypothetical protein